MGLGLRVRPRVRVRVRVRVRAEQLRHAPLLHLVDGLGEGEGWG